MIFCKNGPGDIISIHSDRFFITGRISFINQGDFGDIFVLDSSSVSILMDGKRYSPNETIL